MIGIAFKLIIFPKVMAKFFLLLDTVKGAVFQATKEGCFIVGKT